MSKLTALRLIAVVVPLALATACGDDDGGTGQMDVGADTGNGEMDAGEMDAGEPDAGMGLGNIVEVATADGRFTSLLAVAELLQLTEVLETEELTVFAPTDAAFEALDIDTSSVAAEVLTNVVFAHLAAGSLDSETLTMTGTVTTLANLTHEIVVSTSSVTVRSAPISETDIEASNGIIHVLDAVIVPPTTVQLAEEAGFTQLVAALGSASEAVQAAVDPQTLEGDDPFTVFAPTDEAFANADLIGLDLDEVLATHVVFGQVLAADVPAEVPTASGSTLAASRDEMGNLSLTDPAGNTVNVGPTDIRTLSGVVHVIDGVLIPE